MSTQFEGHCPTCGMPQEEIEKLRAELAAEVQLRQDWQRSHATLFNERGKLRAERDEQFSGRVQANRRARDAEERAERAEGLARDARDILHDWWGERVDEWIARYDEAQKEGEHEQATRPVL